MDRLAPALFSICLCVALPASVRALPPQVIAQKPVLAPHVPVPPPLQPRRKWGDPMTRQSAIGGLWMTSPTMNASLYLKNGLKTDSVAVTPILYLSNGTRYPLPALTLEPSGTAIVDINQGLASQGIAPYADLYGYIELEYQWPWAAISATIKNVDVVNSLIFIYTLQQPPDAAVQSSIPSPTSNSLEGLWWKQEKDVSGFLALANVSTKAINATVRVTDDQDIQLGTHQVTISPQSTKMLILNELMSAASGVGGVYLSYDGPERALAINGGLVDKAVGYSAHLWLLPSSQRSPLPNQQTVTEISFAELGLMTGSADPMMNFPYGTVFRPYSMVRNISDQPATVIPTVWWMSGGASQSAQLAQITVPPHRTQNLNVSALIALAGLKNFNGSVNLVLDTKSEPDALVLSAGSVDQTNTYVFEVIPRGVGESASQALCYWSIGNGDDTMITLWNAADEEQDLVFTLFFSGGKHVYPIVLPARATRMFNISEIVHSSLPDAEGNVIPDGVSDGSAEIAGPQGEHQHIRVSMDAGIYNVRKAVCGTPCVTCNGVVSSYMVDSPFAVGVTATTQQTFYMQYNTGSQYDITRSSSWSSSATAVATVSAGLVNGLSAGSSTISALSEIYEPVYIACATGTTSCSMKSNAIRPSRSASGLVGAIPVNFQFNSAIDLGGGDLFVKYDWESSTDKPADLSSCTVNEIVAYPGSGDYKWPTPFPPATSLNPTPGSVPATDLMVLDHHDLVGYLDTQFRKPYFQNAFTAVQKITYSCVYGSRTLTGTFEASIPITRSVSNNTNGSFYFTVTANIAGANHSAVINPLP